MFPINSCNKDNLQNFNEKWPYWYVYVCEKNSLVSMY